MLAGCGLVSDTGVARREQGAIAAKISNVQVQDYLPGEAGH